MLDMSKVEECMPPINFDVNPSEVSSPFITPPEPVYRNPNSGLEKLVEEQTTEIEKIRYESMKLNAQIEVLNKTVDSQDEKLDKLRGINADLKATNKQLENSNRHYWRNTILVALGSAIFSFLLGLFSSDILTLLIRILQ